MAYERSFDPLDVVNQPACVYLRSKGMYVTGQLEPKHVDEILSHDENCWCNLTQHVVGPDESAVDPRRCVAGRECYRAR